MVWIEKIGITQICCRYSISQQSLLIGNRDVFCQLRSVLFIRRSNDDFSDLLKLLFPKANNRIRDGFINRHDYLPLTHSYPIPSVCRNLLLDLIFAPASSHWSNDSIGIAVMADPLKGASCVITK